MERRRCPCGDGPGDDCGGWTVSGRVVDRVGAAATLAAAARCERLPAMYEVVENSSRFHRARPLAAQPLCHTVSSSRRQS